MEKFAKTKIERFHLEKMMESIENIKTDAQNYLIYTYKLDDLYFQFTNDGKWNCNYEYERKTLLTITFDELDIIWNLFYLLEDRLSLYNEGPLLKNIIINSIDKNDIDNIIKVFKNASENIKTEEDLNATYMYKIYGRGNIHISENEEYGELLLGKDILLINKFLNIFGEIC